MNLAARAGRWSAAHWKTATFGWLAFVGAAVVLGSMHGTVSQTNAEQTNGQAARAEQMLAAADVKNVASEDVLVRSRTLTARRRPSVARLTTSARSLRERRTSATSTSAPCRRTATSRWWASTSPAMRTRPTRESSRR